MKIRVAAAAIALVVVGCGSIEQRVDPVAKLEAREICIVSNSQARETFATTYQKVLEQKGYGVRIVPEGSPISLCPVVSTYRAQWAWGGVTPIMSYAELQVFKDGQLAGRALYNSLRARGNVEKYINAENKITELVEKLFP